MNISPKTLIGSAGSIIGLSLAFSALAFIMSCVSAYKLTQCDFEAPYKAEVLYGIGIIPPVGLVMGFLTIDDAPETPK